MVKRTAYREMLQFTSETSADEWLRFYWNPKDGSFPAQNEICIQKPYSAGLRPSEPPPTCPGFPTGCTGPILSGDLLPAIVLRCSVLSGTLCEPMDCNPPGSSLHEISQARILEWVVNPFSKGSSQPRDQTCVFCIGRRIPYRCKQTILQPLSHHITAAWWWALRRLRMLKAPDAGPRWVRCIPKEWFQWTWTLASSHT